MFGQVSAQFPSPSLTAILFEKAQSFFVIQLVGFCSTGVSVSRHFFPAFYSFNFLSQFKEHMLVLYKLMFSLNTFFVFFLFFFAYEKCNKAERKTFSFIPAVYGFRRQHSIFS